MTVVYDLQAGYIPANYRIDFSTEDNVQTMNLKSLKSFTVSLKDDKGNLVSNEEIQRIAITSKNYQIASLVDVDHNGNLVPMLEFNNTNASNPKSFSLKTNTLSGLVPIDINITFTDANGNMQRRTLSKAITVFSGPPTAMSISYVGVEHNATIGKYIEKFAVSVTDTYNNPVNTKPYVAVGAIVEYAVDGSSIDGKRNSNAPRLWYANGGKLEALGGNKAQLTVTQDIFNHVDIDNDKLVLFGRGYVYNALGKWDIASITNQALQLKDDYNGTDQNDLGFAVGHNARQDLCSKDSREYIGNMRANSYQINENGHALIEFEYDYHLTGKDIMVWVNLVGYQADENKMMRLGEAIKHTLRGAGLEAVPNEVLVPGGATGVVYHFKIKHTNAEEWYQNGHFGYTIGGDCVINNIVDSSNFYDARSCMNNGVAFVDVNVTDPGGNGCPVSIKEVVVAPEF